MIEFFVTFVIGVVTGIFVSALFLGAVTAEDRATIAAYRRALENIRDGRAGVGLQFIRYVRGVLGDEDAGA